MATKAVEIDYSELSAFFDQVEAAGNGALKEELKKFVEGIGDEFLRIVSEEIIRREVVDSRLLLHSFQKGSSDGVWIIRDGGLTLEVGTNVEYASYANDGHWILDEDNKHALRYKADTKNGKHKAGELKLFNGSAARFVPGRWEGERFIYDPNAKTGMLLRQNWVEGSHFLDGAGGAIRTMEKMLPGLMEAKITKWLQDYLGI